MTDSYIEKTLIDAFLTLNDFSGITYIKKDSSGKPLNVSLPNIPFTEPDDKRYFAVSFMANEPDPAGLGTEAENFWVGILQIDIMVPLGAGMEETTAKYDWINRLFQRGKSFGDVMILRTYRAAHGAELAYYRTAVRVEFTATLPK
jgi:hypothetical protein